MPSPSPSYCAFKYCNEVLAFSYALNNLDIWMFFFSANGDLIVSIDEEEYLAKLFSVSYTSLLQLSLTMRNSFRQLLALEKLPTPTRASFAVLPSSSLTS